jgi:hypothetical protein
MNVFFSCFSLIPPEEHLPDKTLLKNGLDPNVLKVGSKAFVEPNMVPPGR